MKKGIFNGTINENDFKNSLSEDEKLAYEKLYEETKKVGADKATPIVGTRTYDGAVEKGEKYR